MEKVKRWWVTVDKWCVELGVSQSLILAIIEQESGGDPDAIRYEPAYEKAYIKSSSAWLVRCRELGITTAQAATSYGLMQLMFPTAWGYGCRSIEQALDPDQNVRFGTKHIAVWLEKFGGDKATALAYYNGGDGGVGALRAGKDTQATRYARAVMALYNKYRDDALKAQEAGKKGAAITVPKLSYFEPSELACRCCGLNRTTPALLETLNTIRAALGRPVTVNSGTRCKKHNAEVGGVANSNHMTGEAADIRVATMNAADVRKRILAMWNAGQLPHLAGLGKYKTFTHVDVAPKVAGRLRTWAG